MAPSTATDFLDWQRGESPEPYSAIDLGAWHSNYGVDVLAPRAATAIPEPAAALLALAACAMVGAADRCRTNCPRSSRNE